MAFTEEQNNAINTEGKNIIVSAGAGSGKTAVLTARVIRKLKTGIDIDKLLILTFTNEAAKEMKNRIRKAIIEANLKEQLPLLNSAFITTFDSYALSLVKKYHYKLNISPNIKIIDKDIITIYKYKLLDQIFENMYGEEKFNNLINDFCLKDDKTIKNYIIDTSNKLDLIVDKNKYLNNYLNNFFSDSNLNILISEYISLIKSKINELDDIYANLINYLNEKTINELKLYLKPLKEGKTYEDYILFKENKIIRFTNLEEEAINLKEQFKIKAGEIKELLRFKDTDEITSSIKNSKQHIEVIINIINELDKKVLAYKNKYEAYEFNDISHMAIEIVEKNPDINKELRNYYNEIMIDEYQDTSDLQETFIKYIENNNVYMVGDIKQSIYRFRNANPYIFQEKYNQYSKNNGGIKIDLLKNFRSRKETLSNINEIFNLIMDEQIGSADYKKSHNMLFGNNDYEIENNNQSNFMEIYNYKIDKEKKETEEEKELFIISKDIQEKITNNYQIYDKFERKLRNLKYSDICILTDRNKYLNTYKKILEYNNIPSVIYMDETLNNDMVILVIKNLINLVLNVKNNIYDDKFKYLYTSISRSFLFEYNDDTIRKTIINNTYNSDQIIKKCQEISINNSLELLINDIIYKFNVYEKLIKLNDIQKNIIKISNLIDIARNLNSLNYSIQDFIEYLNDAIEMDLPVKYSVNTTNENAVKIMNIHKSKGLEFSLCYYTGLSNKFTLKEINTKFITSNKYGLILPYMNNSELENTILKDLYTNNYFKEEISEKIRLFYVSLTRCREKMIILAPEQENKETFNKLVPNNYRLKYRSFLDIINSINVIDKYTINKDMTYNKNYHQLLIKNIENNKIDIKIEKRKINLNYEKIENKQFSKENNKLISKEDLKSIEYGTKIHQILEYEDFKNSNNELILNLKKQIDNDFINIYHEYEFTYNIDKNIYHGKIDLLIEYEKYIYIIDYKLKNITDNEYLNQLLGYKNYLKKITNKNIKTYLYSIINNELKEVNIEK